MAEPVNDRSRDASGVLNASLGALLSRHARNSNRRAAIVGGKVVKFVLPPALAKAYRRNAGRTMTDQQAVNFVEANRRRFRGPRPSATRRVF